jgi:uncharacterized protein (TIGR02001 family)
MLKKKLLVAALVASFAAPAMAEESPFSANVSITSNYLYRGLSQTGNKPALQGGFDYAHESGFYAGVWGSSISWLSDFGVAANAGTEFDTYAGFSGEAGDIGYDVGFLRYNYPGEYGGNLTANTNELYGSVSYKFVTAKYSRSSGNLFGFADSSGSGYLDLSASYDLEDAGISLGAHYGKQTVANNSASDYTDYNFSVSKEIGGYGFSMMYSKTDLTSIDPQGNDLGKGALVLAISKSM